MKTVLPRFADCVRFVLIVAVLSSMGCAFGEIRLGDPFDRKLTLEEAQHRYTVLVRWSEFQKARDFVAKDERDAFMSRMENLKDARFTDYESDSIELDDDKQNATIDVEYTLYLPATPYELVINETQVWSRDGVSNKWRVDSTFEDSPRVASN